jgi:hypothetical protein
LLCLVLVAPARARPIEISFSTLPPDCTVVDLSNPEGPSGVGGLRVERPIQGGSLTFRLLKPGYNSLEVTIPQSALPQADRLVWPARQGSFLRLEPLLVTATFLTTPRGAQIWTSRSGQSDDYLGLTGDPLLLNLADLLGASEAGFFRVRLVAAGYQTVDVPVPQHLFGVGRPNRWPAEGEYALAPTGGVLAPLVFFFRLKPWSGVLIAVVALSFAALLLRLIGKAWGVVRRAANIERRAAEPGTSLSGSRLGPYRLFEMLGKGATATVFRGAKDHQTPTVDFAIKVFNLSDTAVERLANEVRPLLELRHPNLVGLVDWGQAEGFAYLVTELVPGRTLRQELHHGPLGLQPWKALVDDLLLGMQHAHDKGIVHGDIKPENILLPYHGKSKLVDFGLARRSSRPGLDRFGGTPGYMAPELMVQHTATPLTDQFAAGTVLFEALYGVFPGDSSWQPDIFTELAPAILKMRDPDPAKRYADAEEARQALQSVRVRDSSR